MYTSTEKGFGQQVINKNLEERVLKQLLESGLRTSTVINDRRVDIYLSPDMAKLPYNPKNVPEAGAHWMLPEHDRKNITDVVDRVFREATGISRKLDPKNPKDLPWIRTWLRLRDHIMGCGVRGTTRGVRQLIRYPPFRTSLGQPPAVSKNPWPCETSLPPCTTQRVSTGGYGTALLWFTDTHCINNQVIELLKRSQRFMDKAADLDKQYVPFWGVFYCSKAQKDLAQDQDGVVTQAPYAGKRVLEIRLGMNGSAFMLYGALGNPFSFDVMFIEPPDTHQTSERQNAHYIAHIAHETTHAHNMLTSTHPPANTLQVRVENMITEEAKTRHDEAQIIAQITSTIPGTPNGLRLRNAFSGLTGSTDVWQIQRDFFPGEMKQTYLEHFVFSELSLEAIRRERLQVDDIKRINEEVDKLEIGYKAAQSIRSSYGRWRHLLRGIDLNWKNLLKRLGSLPNNTNPEKERLLRLHASRFNGLAQYDPNPRIP